MASEVMTFTASNVTVVTTAETAVVTTPSITYDQPTGQGLRISGVISVNPVGTAATAAQVRVRQGNGTNGPLIGIAEPETVAAGNQIDIPFDVEDTTRAAAGGLQYTVTIQFTAATGNSTVVQASIDAKGL